MPRIPVIAVFAVFGLTACSAEDYTRDPVYSAVCTVQDTAFAAPLPGVAGYHPASFLRPVSATGVGFEDLRSKLAAQDAGTFDHPCVALTIDPLNPAPPVDTHQIVVNPEPSVPPASFTVHFAFNQTRLDAPAQATIALAANWLIAHGDAHIDVVGHTDTAGPAGYNVGLSERRAHVVAQALYADGVPKGIVQQTGTGEADLLVPTGNGVRLRANRRAVITAG